MCTSCWISDGMCGYAYSKEQFYCSEFSVNNLCGSDVILYDVVVKPRILHLDMSLAQWRRARERERDSIRVFCVKSLSYNCMMWWSPFVMWTTKNWIWKPDMGWLYTFVLRCVFIRLNELRFQLITYSCVGLCLYSYSYANVCVCVCVYFLNSLTHPIFVIVCNWVERK